MSEEERKKIVDFVNEKLKSIPIGDHKTFSFTVDVSQGTPKNTLSLTIRT